MKAKIITLFLAICFFAGYGQVQAAIITIQIAGEVTEGYGSLWGGDINTGAVFTGTYTYDSATPNTSTWDYVGLYVHDSPYGLTISLGEYEFKTSSNHSDQFEIAITDNGPNLDGYDVRSYQNDSLSNGATVNTFFWRTGGSDSMLSSTDLPNVAPDVNQWPGLLHIFGKDALGNGYLIRGTVTQAVLIPEPSSVVLMVIGIFYLRHRQ